MQNLNIKEIPWIKCEGGNMLWESYLMFKRVSPLISQSGQEELLPGEVYICKKCGKVPKFFWEKAKEIPEEIRSECHLPKSKDIIPDK
jgi:hypothetical protein